MRVGEFMKWYYGEIYETKEDYNITEKINSYFNITEKFQVNEYNVDNLKYIEAINNSCKYNDCNRDEIIILGDINVKNISELREKYNLNNVSINEIIKVLYKNNGINFLNDLYGSFSLVIIDYEQNKIYLIRDQIGEKQLFWGIIDKRIFFGSDLFLLDNFYDKTILNLEYFKLFCANLGYTDYTLTPYKNIFRVKSGSYIEIDMDNLEIKNKVYWKLKDTNINLDLENEEEYIEKFKQLIINSINHCIRKDKLNALSLSGGLDSTSIFALIKKYIKSDIEPYCGIFEDLRTCDERQYINETLKMYSTRGNYVNLDDCGVLVDYPENYFYTSEPHVNILNKKFSEKINLQVQNNSIEVLCDGFFADHILTGNGIFLSDNKVSKKEKKRIITEIADSMNLNFIESVYRYLLLPKINKGYVPEIDECLLKSNKEDLINVKKYSNKEMILQLKAISSKFFGDRELSPRYQIERVHPFIDREIIEFLYWIPGQFRLNGENAKYILKQTVKYIIPTIITERISKTQHVELTQKGLRDNWNNIFNILKAGRITKIPYINITKDQWIEELLRFRSGQITNDKIYIFLALEVWLQQVESNYGNVKFE